MVRQPDSAIATILCSSIVTTRRIVGKDLADRDSSSGLTVCMLTNRTDNFSPPTNQQPRPWGRIPGAQQHNVSSRNISPLPMANAGSLDGPAVPLSCRSADRPVHLVPRPQRGRIKDFMCVAGADDRHVGSEAARDVFARVRVC